MKTLKRLITGVLVSAMLLSTAAVALADDTPTVTPDQPAVTAPAPDASSGAAVANPDKEAVKAERQAKREALEVFKKGLEAERDQLKEQAGILKGLREEIKAKMEQVKSLVAAARQAKDHKALLKARSDRAMIQAHLQVVREKTEANKALWAELKQAVQSRDLQRAVVVARQIIANRQVKIEALRKVSQGLDRVIEDLQSAGRATPSSVEPAPAASAPATH